MLSGAVTKIGRMVDLEPEIASAQAYVEMFHSRFGKCIAFSADVPRRVVHVRVPALILQPLVENALSHGFPNQSRSLSITVSARAIGGPVEISVIDVGPGIPDRRLASIRRSLRSRRGKCKLTGPLGLSPRLSYYYPNLPNLRLHNTDAGLDVTISIPLRRNSRPDRGRKLSAN